MFVFYTVCLLIVWLWYCNVGVCLSHFLRSVFFPSAMLPAFDIIFMCPVLTNSIFGARARSRDMGWSGGVKENMMCIFQFEKFKASDVCCLFWKRKKGEKKHEIKYFLSSSSVSGWLLNLFSASTVSFVSQHQEQRKEYMAIHLSLTFQVQIPLSSPPLPTRHTPTSRPQTLPSLLFSFRKWLIPHCCLCGWRPECTSVPQASQDDFCGNWFYSLCGPHMKTLHLWEHRSALHCSSQFPLIYIFIY